VIRTLVKLAAALWVLRWLAMELAAYAGRRRDAQAPPALDPARKPGHMPGPFDQ
jgi:hypothetical protein